jgi:hypothetical protein
MAVDMADTRNSDLPEMYVLKRKAIDHYLTSMIMTIMRMPSS